MKINVGVMDTEVDFEHDTLLQEKVHGIMHTELGVKVDGAHYSRAYRSGHWDGISDFYDYKGDKFHTGLLPQFLKGIRKLQDSGSKIDYEIIDNRPPQLVHPDSIDEEIVLGDGDSEPIKLRDKQYEAVQEAIREQVITINGATNFGKTEVAAGIMQQLGPYLPTGNRIAFFCNSQEIFKQTTERLAKRLDIDEADIGTIGGGKFNIEGRMIVVAMVPTLASSLKSPQKGVKFTPKERVIKFMAELAPKFRKTQNTRHLIRNYIKNSKLTTKVWESALEHLQYIAYDEKFNDKTAQMQLNKYTVELDKIIEKKNKTKFDRYTQAQDFIDTVTVAIQDEAHEINGQTVFDTMIKLDNAQYRIALTGTVDKKNEMLWQKIQAVFSARLFKVSNEYLIKEGFSSKPIIRMLPMIEPRNIEIVDEYLTAYKAGIVENDVRNETIAHITNWFVDNKIGGVLISVNHIDHGERLKELLEGREVDCEFTHGGLESDLRASYLERFSKGEVRVLIASSILDQGVDVQSIGALVMGGGNKSLRQNLQRIGRGLRINGIEGNTLQVFDFIDKTNVHLLNHSKERMKIYREEKFEIKIMGK